MPERHRTFDLALAGGDLRVGEWLAGEGDEQPPVVALHGLTGSHVSWLFLADALPARRMVAPDLRGRGGSRRLPGPYGLAAHADDVAALIRMTSAGPVPVVGHSMGGFIAMVLAERHPDLVDDLVLVDGGLPFAARERAHTEQVVAGIRAGLEVEYTDLAAYQESFRQQPAFARDWTPYVDEYLAYDLVGEPPAMRRSADTDAVLADQQDIDAYPLAPVVDEVLELLGGAAFLHADRGFLDDPPGLYTADTVAAHAARWPALRCRHVSDVNHYTIAMSARGAAAIAEAVQPSTETR